MVPTDGSAPGQGLLVIAARSGHQPGFAASLGLDLKENWGLDVISERKGPNRMTTVCQEGKATLGARPGTRSAVARHLVTLHTCCTLLGQFVRLCLSFPTPLAKTFSQLLTVLPHSDPSFCVKHCSRHCLGNSSNLSGYYCDSFH